MAVLKDPIQELGVLGTDQGEEASIKDSFYALLGEAGLYKGYSRRTAVK